MSIAFKRLKPLLNRVVIQKAEPLTKTKGGILLPDSKGE
jgi:co-chaperonin GroES (HSP10)